MAVTRLKRKGLRNKAKANVRLQEIKRLTTTPVIKNVDVEAIKEEFAKKSASKAAPKAKKEEATEAKAKKQEEPLKNHPTDKE